MAEGLRDHQESNESDVCDDVIDVPNPIPSLLDKCPSTSDLARQIARRLYLYFCNVTGYPYMFGTERYPYMFGTERY